ncbi:MAG: diguanylate cyclase [Lachnospiraceae bacterium]|nr:diguanylate cyclase [Lachnospiraceae bacterium]
MDSFFMNDSYTMEDLERIFRAIPANVFFKDTLCRYQIASQVCSMLTEGDADFSIIGKTDLEVQKEPALGKQYYEEDCRLIAEGGQLKYLSEMHFGGQTYYYEIIKRAVYQPDGKILGIIGMVTDRTETIALQHQLRTISLTDALTQLHNRTFFQQYLENQITPEQLPISIIACDCNNLKYINDTFGHLCEQIEAKQFSSPDHSYSTGLACGFFTITDCAESLEESVKYADYAMYVKKRMEKQPYCILDR